MDKFKWLVIVALFLIAVQPSFADDGPKILGIWKMVSIDWEVQATGDRIPFILEMNPAGYVIYTPEGRMMTIATRDGRKPPVTTQDRAKLFDSMNAFTGTYRLEGDKCIIKVDVASAPASVGLERVSFLKFDGDGFNATSDWMPGAGGQMGRTIITWERVK
jgi:hypothetical protein